MDAGIKCAGMRSRKHTWAWRHRHTARAHTHTHTHTLTRTHPVLAYVDPEEVRPHVGRDPHDDRRGDDGEGPKLADRCEDRALPHRDAYVLLLEAAAAHHRCAPPEVAPDRLPHGLVRGPAARAGRAQAEPPRAACGRPAPARSTHGPPRACRRPPARRQRAERAAHRAGRLVLCSRGPRTHGLDLNRAQVSRVIFHFAFTAVWRRRRAPGAWSGTTRR